MTSKKAEVATPKLTEEEAVAILAKKVALAERAIKEAEDHATKHKLSFSLSIAYGMGGYFEDGQWNPSSNGC